jgi:hypothetical protein
VSDQTLLPVAEEVIGGIAMWKFIDDMASATSTQSSKVET